ncbi:Zn(II)2Cys6 transcription factor [Aspergillus homomorphus CBS 101889]|uniref:Zn(II)2Cys6 transcription factor n=1 Tax=Aspergillus homomorphus (strain CBS 101889) TaxID=1450537 RepID=A0A395HWI9_ASPHC|nr:Zn(II)2Cys6 transcription factor [Aspergillus homomorphus CBS 101889]RAL11793.1 Zn(II)2Cys6 transcription factor [Aspergillus homomorphus CBS 101889]
MLEANRKARRAAAACVACRRSKIKCSGDRPCKNCQRRATKCQYSDSSTRVLVSERYLRDLENRARANQAGAAKPSRSSYPHQEDFPDLLHNPTTRGSESSPETESMLSIWTSPFTLPTPVIVNAGTTKRNWLWLAPTSPWSFVARLAVMMSGKLNMDSHRTLKFHIDGDIYPLDWRSQVPTEESLDPGTLPSLDHAIYSINNVKFHLGQVYRFLPDDFCAQVQDFYASRGAYGATQSCMWFIRFLLLLAFGKAFSSRTRSHGTPPGAKMFLRAMSLMPNHTSTGNDSLDVIENLALAALYLYAIDHREGAHSHVGQAIRLAQLEGLHTQLPEQELGHATVARCRNLWWTLYILDRQISSSLGLPMTVQDFDITTLVEISGPTPQDPTLSLQVRLSQMMSSILSRIYRAEKTQIGRFLDVTSDILQKMAGLAEEIEKIFPAGFQDSMDTMPHETRYIILLYHQCVIMATRPLLLSVLRERLEKLGRAEEEEWQKFLALPKSLLSIGIRSAVKTLEILSDENIILETFLPFDLEFTFAAALHLTIAQTLFHLEPAEQSHAQAAQLILDEIVASGNRVAEVRRVELAHIQSLFGEFASRMEEEGLQNLSLPGIMQEGQPVRGSVPGEEELFPQAEEPPAIGWPASPESNTRSTTLAEEDLSRNLDFLDTFGISSHKFLSIVDQIGQRDLTQELWGPQAE